MSIAGSRGTHELLAPTSSRSAWKLKFSKYGYIINKRISPVRVTSFKFFNSNSAKGGKGVETVWFQSEVQVSRSQHPGFGAKKGLGFRI